jgi:tRNA pseudouridine55 synthase
MTGVLLVDKPSGLTSHDVVDRIRAASGIRRVGHTGTLDPAATGLLIVCLGQATRLSEHLTGLSKSYEGVMRLGITTDSYDLDCSTSEEQDVPELKVEEIQAVCDQFTGQIEQIPPMVSAVKVGGERLYKKARKGEVVERKPRSVNVSEFAVLQFDSPDVRLRVSCSTGTYVRSLCHEVGLKLGCGAALASLRRTHVGRHSVLDAHEVDVFQGIEDIKRHLLPMGDILDLPTVVLMQSGLTIVNTGGTLLNAHLLEGCPVREGWVQIKNEKQELLALGTVEATSMGAQIHPRRVFSA